MSMTDELQFRRCDFFFQSNYFKVDKIGLGPTHKLDQIETHCLRHSLVKVTRFKPVSWHLNIPLRG